MFLFYLTQRRFILEITQKLSHKQKTPQKEGLLDEDSSVARDRIELPTQGFSVLCSTD